MPRTRKRTKTKVSRISEREAFSNQIRLQLEAHQGIHALLDAQHHNKSWLAKLMISWHLGKRDFEDARDFMLDLAGRFLTRIQLTTDGHGVNPKAVWEAFGTDIDFAQLTKTYAVLREPDVRYSPPICTGAVPSRVCGSPIPEDICTSHVERANRTLRMGQRRYTRLTNGFSKNFENLCWSVALFFTYYNFCKVHKTLRVTPAMEAGLSDHVWEISELVGLLEAEERAAIGTAKNKRGPYRKIRDSK